VNKEKLISEFAEKMTEVYVDRDAYSRGKIIDLAKDAFADVVNKNCNLGALLEKKGGRIKSNNMESEEKIKQMKKEVRKGTLAICGIGCLGLITDDNPQEITYPDGNKSFAWVGIHLTDKVCSIGGKWLSRNPIVVGHIDDYLAPVDFKYMQIPNICFSLANEDDKREMEFKKQRLERGFDDSETWSLRDTIANFIIPRLERYEEMAKKFLKRDPELEEDVECFLNAMRLVSRDNGALILTKEEEERMWRGLDAFPKIFMSLWW
jgi:hypothetical protein